MRKKQHLLPCMLLMMVGLITIAGNTASAIEQTTLFVTMDSAWEHATEGDTFVVRADVQNIGDNPALITHVRLENIPENWDVRPNQHVILLLMPGQIQAKFFVVERGATDATIYTTAQAYNSPLVQSNRIAIPINIGIVAGFSLLCGFMLYKEVKIRKNIKK